MSPIEVMSIGKQHTIISSNKTVKTVPMIKMMKKLMTTISLDFSKLPLVMSNKTTIV